MNMKPNMGLPNEYQISQNMQIHPQYQQFVGVPQANPNVQMNYYPNQQQQLQCKGIYVSQQPPKRVEKPKEKQNFQQEKYYKDKPADFKYLHAQGYDVTKELGRGGYGVVYKACEFRDGQRNKAKKFAIKINFQTVSPELIYSEIAFLTLLQGSPNTPQMIDMFTQDEKTHIVIEYFKYQPFIKFFADSSMEDIKHYIYQMLLGVRTLKSMGIYHRDVKPGNFLYNIHEKKGILIDYGLSEIDDKFIEILKEQQKIKQDPEIQKRIDLYQNIKKCERIVGKNKIGTESFMPLESILRFKEQGYQVDIWPIGVVFLQFLLKKYNIFNNVRMQNKPNQNKNNNKSGQIKNTYFITFILELANIFGSEAVIDLCKKYEYELLLPNELPRHPVDFKEIIKKEDFDDTACDLLKKLIALDQNERISVEDAINHPFFDSIREYESNKQSQQQNQKQPQNQIQVQVQKGNIQMQNEQQQLQQFMKKNQQAQQQLLLNQPVAAAAAGATQLQNQAIVNPYQQISMAYPAQFQQGISIIPQIFNPHIYQGAQVVGQVVNQPNFQGYPIKNTMNMQQQPKQ